MNTKATKPISTIHQPKQKPRAVNAAAEPTKSGHQLCGLKKPISPVPSETSA